MKKICKYCNKEFAAKRSTAAFCSDAHRTAYGKLNKSGGTVIMQGRIVKNEFRDLTSTAELVEGTATVKPGGINKYFVPADPPFLDKFGAPTDKPAGEPVTVHLTEKDQSRIGFAGFEFPIKEVEGMAENTFTLVKPEFEWEKKQLEHHKLQGNIIKDYNRAHPWVKEVEEYCNTAGITPQELISTHRNQNKPYKKLKQPKEAKIQQTSEFHKRLLERKLKAPHKSDD